MSPSRFRCLNNLPGYIDQRVVLLRLVQATQRLLRIEYRLVLADFSLLERAGP